LEKLAEMEHRPWHTLTKEGLAKMLRPFGVRPDVLRIGRPERGYDRAWFADAFARYAPPPAPKDEPAAPVTPVTPVTPEAEAEVAKDLRDEATWRAYLAAEAQAKRKAKRGGKK